MEVSGKYSAYKIVRKTVNQTRIKCTSNGQVVMTIQEQLALASDTKKSTWLDRMEKLGSYDALRKQAIKAYNNNTVKQTSIYR